MYEFEILLKHNKGGQEAKETSGGGNKKKEYLSKIQKEFLQLILVFVKRTQRKTDQKMWISTSQEISKSINLWKNGKPFNSPGKWKPKIPPHIRTPEINNNPIVSEDTEQWELSYTVHGNVNCYNHFGKLAVSINTILGL